MTDRKFTRIEKVSVLRNMLVEAAVEARAEQNRAEGYVQQIKNPFAGIAFEGFETMQSDHRKALAEAILYTDAATLLDEVLL